MKYTLTDIYSAYSALQTAYGLFNIARNRALNQLLGKDLADKAKAVVFTSSDLLNFLKETQAWNEEEKFLNEFIRINRFRTGTKYAVFSNKYYDKVGTAFIYDRFFLDSSWYATIKTNINGEKSVGTYKIEKYQDKTPIETLPFEKNYIIYADREDDKTEESSNRN